MLLPSLFLIEKLGLGSFNLTIPMTLVGPSICPFGLVLGLFSLFGTHPRLINIVSLKNGKFHIGLVKDDLRLQTDFDWLWRNATVFSTELII